MRSETVSTKLDRIAEQAVQNPEMQFTTLAHLIDEDFLREAFRYIKKKAAAGVDGVTAKEYAQALDANIADLYQRMRSGRYVAPPVRRVWLEKDDGKQRPIGIPALEDKILQRAVTMLLTEIYEQVFYACSHGFRRKKSAHHALREIREKCMSMGIRWILDADIKGYFDSIRRDLLREFLRKKMNDGTIIRGNYKPMEVYFEYTERAWKTWLGCRHRNGFIDWETFEKYHRVIFPLPRPRIVHQI